MICRIIDFIQLINSTTLYDLNMAVIFGLLNIF